MSRKIDFRVIDWEKAIKLSIDLAKRVENQFSPDALICILRGGSVVGRIIADYLKLKEFFAVKVSLYQGIEEKKEKVEITQGLDCDLHEKDAIVVDDIVDTGKTLSTVMDYLQKSKVKKIKSGVLHWKPWANFDPEFKVKTVKEWVVYPWEYNEFISLAKQKLKSKKVNEEEKERIRRTISTVKSLYSIYT